MSSLAAVSLGAALVVGLSLPDSVSAAPTTPLYPQCPPVGYSTGCQKLITINAQGVATVATDPSQPAIDNQDDSLVGVVNDSNASLVSLGLTGDDVFGFDGDGLCASKPTPCTSKNEYGPTGYEGPGTSFTVTAGTTDAGSVNFTNDLTPGASAYFTLEEPGFEVASVSLLPDIALKVLPLTGVEGAPVTPASVATFTDGPSTAPASEFTAKVTFGDGNSATGTVTGGSGQPYVVSAPHTYVEEGSYTTGVTVTDTQLALNTATGAGIATIADAPITVSPETIPDQTTNVAFDGPVASVIDGNPVAPVADFTATINWGDGTSTSAGTISQPGVVGTAFIVSGSHTYTNHGSFTVTVDVNDVGGSTGSTTDPVTVADAVVTCSGSGCSGTAASTSQSSSVTSSSTTGQILADLDSPQGQFTCGDKFRHAPQITTITDANLGAAIDLTVTFKNSAAAGAWWVPFAVCYQSQTPFKDLYGRSTLTGLLPFCTSPPWGKPAVAPCVRSIYELPFSIGKVVEDILVPTGDPRAH